MRGHLILCTETAVPGNLWNHDGGRPKSAPQQSVKYKDLAGVTKLASVKMSVADQNRMRSFVAKFDDPVRLVTNSYRGLSTMDKPGTLPIST